MPAALQLHARESVPFVEHQGLKGKTGRFAQHAPFVLGDLRLLQKRAFHMADYSTLIGAS